MRAESLIFPFPITRLTTPKERKNEPLSFPTHPGDLCHNVHGLLLPHLLADVSDGIKENKGGIGLIHQVPWVLCIPPNVGVLCYRRFFGVPLYTGGI